MDIRISKMQALELFGIELQIKNSLDGSKKPTQSAISKQWLALSEDSRSDVVSKLKNVSHVQS